MKIKKILLFIPPALSFKKRIDINPLPPLGLGYLGSTLEKYGFEVKIVDSLIEGWNNRTNVADGVIRIGLSFEDIEKIIIDFDPDIVGVNNLFTRQRENAHKIYALAKNSKKDIITIAGGAHPSVMPELVLGDSNVDYVILGEGDKTIIDLMYALKNSGDLSKLDGIGYREGNAIKIIPKSIFIKDLDGLPFPAWHLLNMEKYFGLKVSHGDRQKKRFSPVITSRGCPAHCTFCSAYAVWGRGFRPRSPENVIFELKELKKLYNIEEIMFEDDNLTLDPQRAEALFDAMIREQLNLTWDTPNGIAAWTLSENLLNKMKQSGCRNVNFAIESGNQQVLDFVIKKPLKLEKVKPLVSYAKKIGLNVGLFLVIGMPGETEEQIWDSFRLAVELGIYTPHISVATPYPGSELYDRCKSQKLFKPDFSLDDLYIRSFSIAGGQLDDIKLRKILADGQRYLYASFFKKHPFAFIRLVIFKFFRDPGAFIRKLSAYLSGQE
ncbi:MAG: cobalamin-dependent protein [Candidatus Omnitrophica bacterium]|nr:cobalamin-dependent protein [Candidatus Omnitrophota bacterium]